MECPARPGTDRFEIARWLIREFGADVNLENDAENAYIIESMRHLLHRAADYAYFDAAGERRCPPCRPRRELCGLTGRLAGDRMGFDIRKEIRHADRRPQ